MKQANAISIILCTCNRAEYLRQTLTALSRVHTPDGLPCELIVVDNGSVDHTAQVVQERRLPQMPVRYVEEPQRGQSQARNTGLQASSGEIILFTDDDIEPSPSWICGMCAPLMSGEADAVAGGIRIAPDLLRAWMEPLHRIFLASTEWLIADAPQMMVGANMAFSRRVLSQVPGFDVQIGPGTLGLCDDHLFSQQLKQAGFRIGSALDTVVTHHFQPERLARGPFLKSAENHGRSMAYIDHHWHHKTLSDGQIAGRLARRSAALLLGRQKNRRQPARAEGIPLWEFQRVEQLAYLRQFLKEKRRPRQYEKHGLCKLTNHAPLMPR